MPGCSATTTTLAQQLAAAGEATGEKLWRMPLGEAYDKLIKLRHRRHEEHRRPAGRLDHRGAVHPALRQRQALGASRHRRHGLVHEGRAAACRRAPPRSACACSTGWWREHYEAADGADEVMAEIGFYHLTRTGAGQALPQLLGRTLAAGQRALVLCGERGAAGGAGRRRCGLCRAGLAAARHGSGRRRRAAADLAGDRRRGTERRAIPVPGGRRRAARGSTRSTRVFDLFDGNDAAAVEAARARWAAAKAAGHALAYWQQGPRGWTKQA